MGHSTDEIRNAEMHNCKIQGDIKRYRGIYGDIKIRRDTGGYRVM